MQNNYQPHLFTPPQPLENITTLESPSQQKPKPETIGPKSTDSTKKGVFWEKEVSRECALRGYNVFMNEYPTGAVDLVIGINGEYYPFDVKTDRWNYESGEWRAANGSKIADGVWGISVNPETARIRWPNYQGTNRPKCPPGWEDIWN